ncbi:MAG: hypothetical protein HY055_03045 [Magnetospirillum sp.]|nr:hypothetical protein [Magnetospirillum sp.]
MNIRPAPLLLALLLASCSAPAPEPGAPQRPRGIQFSPNSEPLDGGPLGTPRCEEAMAQWFARVDANHDGALDRQEFLSDARAQFARMDLDHDGFITADELWTYRQPHVQPHPRKADDKTERRGSREPTHAVSDGQADPVMSADTNLDFKVSLAEFVAQADSVFATFDRDHNGRLSLAEVQTHGCVPLPNRPILVD